jgi:hypothetical protein
MESRRFHHDPPDNKTNHLPRPLRRIAQSLRHSIWLSTYPYLQPTTLSPLQTNSPHAVRNIQHPRNLLPHPNRRLNLRRPTPPHRPRRTRPPLPPHETQPPPHPNPNIPNQIHHPKNPHPPTRPQIHLSNSRDPRKFPPLLFLIFNFFIIRKKTKKNKKFDSQLLIHAKKKKN